MKQTYLFLMIMLWATLAVAQAPFITTYEVEEGDLDITIGTNSSVSGYSYTVDFGDGTVFTDQWTDRSHVYAEAGVYTVSISGNYPKAQQKSNSAKKLKSIEQWGDIEWKSMYLAFYGCSNLVVNATDAPDLSQVNSLRSMFYGCSSITTLPGLETWDTSKVITLQSMFSGCTSITTLPGIETWDVSNVINMEKMFSGATNFNQSLNDWDVSSVTSVNEMFSGATNFNQPLNSWDFSGLTSSRRMFKDAISFNQPLNKWDVSNISTMDEIFYGATSFNQPLNAWDVSNV
ncbi:BspA family leucine-rich repeat surface protein, partial [Mangrovimonas sp. DI 80]|uniref:BspA family leucine-rich repeat surface protein n=1 Tax=Mangrovimonas sp. DI 80 TaxID=1779330 RepID=UPI0009C82E47